MKCKCRRTVMVITVEKEEREVLPMRQSQWRRGSKGEETGSTAATKATASTMVMMLVGREETQAKKEGRANKEKEKMEEELLCLESKAKSRKEEEGEEGEEGDKSDKK